MIKIPGDSGWKISHDGDLLGNVNRHKNLDFSKGGYLSLARKPIALFTEHAGVSATGDPDFQDVVAITADSSYYYVLTTDHVFGITSSDTAFSVAEVSASSIPTFSGTSDMVPYIGGIAFTGSTTLNSLAGFNGSNGSGTWTDRSLSLSSSYPHPLCVSGTRRTLLIGNGNIIYQTTAGTWTDDSSNRLTIPDEYIVTSIRWRGGKAYIGTRTLSGNRGALFVWSGSGTVAESMWPVEADWVYSVCEYESSVAVLTSAGQLLRFNGGGFDVLANLPVYYSPYSWTENAGGGTIGKAINRGMWSIGDKIYFTIQGEPRGLFAPGAYEQPGGLWEYNPSVGLHHKAGFVTEPYRILTISTLLSNEFTFSTPHQLQTGDAVYADTVTNIAALTEGYVYYAIRTSSTSIKLANSPADAYAGRNILCSGSISGDKLSVDTMDTVGNITNCVPGAVFGFNKNQPSPFFASEVFFSGSSYDPTHTVISSLMSFGMGRNVGSFQTPKIQASGVKDLLSKLYTFVHELRLDTDKITFKYRTSERFGLPGTTLYGTGGRATWVSDTSFTINTALKDVKSAEVGDEVEITGGAGAGYSAHITEINDNTATWTFTLDEAIPEISANDTSDIYVNNWKKIHTATNADFNNQDDFIETVVGEVSGISASWYQFKFEIQGRNIDINMVQFITSKDKDSN